jgi:hypothetical protein
LNYDELQYAKLVNLQTNQSINQSETITAIKAKLLYVLQINFVYVGFHTTKSYGTAHILDNNN